MRSASWVPAGSDAEVDLPLQALLAHGIPALVVLADMAVTPFTRQMVGIVRCLVGDIGKEGLAITPVGVDETDQLVGIGLCRVIVVGQLVQVMTILSVKTDSGEAPVKLVMSQ